MSFCKFSNYTELWCCVKVQTVHSTISRNVPKAAHSMFQSNWIERPFATFGSSCALEGAHQECMCKTDQPPCQLMRSAKLNNRIEIDTYFSLYWLLDEIKSNVIILYLNIVAITLHSSTNKFSGLLLMEHMCLWTQPTPHGVGVLCMGNHPALWHYKKNRGLLLAGTILIRNSNA